jgi:hypothetical protein
MSVQGQREPTPYCLLQLSLNHAGVNEHREAGCDLLNYQTSQRVLDHLRNELQSRQNLTDLDLEQDQIQATGVLSSLNHAGVNKHREAGGDLRNHQTSQRVLDHLRVIRLHELQRLQNLTDLDLESDQRQETGECQVHLNQQDLPHQSRPSLQQARVHQIRLKVRRVIQNRLMTNHRGHDQCETERTGSHETEITGGHDQCETEITPNRNVVIQQVMNLNFLSHQ